MYNKIALDWRLKGQRYRLEGRACPHCGAVHFPPRGVCSECGRPMNGMAKLTESEEPAVIRPPAPFARKEEREMALAEA
jgi:uncharacterized OB-fold protein